jgi:SAM-dependent methyltransferase
MAQGFDTSGSAHHGDRVREPGGNLIPNSRLGARLRELERGVIRWLGGRSERDVEHDFIRRQVGSRSLRILEIGGVGSMLSLDLARAGHAVTTCDIYPYPARHPNLQSIQGDFLKWQFGSAAFDAVILLSTLEHIGFGYYHDSVLGDGDRAAVRKVRELLRESGRLVLTTPFSGRGRIVDGFERWYDMARLTDLLAGFKLVACEFWVPKVWLFGRCLKWVYAAADEAAQSEALYHYHAIVCLVAEKTGA